MGKWIMVLIMVLIMFLFSMFMSSLPEVSLVEAATYMMVFHLYADKLDEM